MSKEIDIAALRKAAQEANSSRRGEPYAAFLVAVRPAVVLALLDRLEQAEKDAALYRWLRDQVELEGGSDYVFPWIHAWDYKPGPQPNEQFSNLDDAIRAAMQGEGE